MEEQEFDWLSNGNKNNNTRFSLHCHIPEQLAKNLKYSTESLNDINNQINLNN